MAYTTSKRETILAYLLDTTLIQIDGSAPYNNDLSLISRNFVYPEDLRNDQFPALIVLDDFVTRYTQMTANEYTTGTNINEIDQGMQIGLAGYVKINSPGDQVLTGDLSTEMNTLHSDIIIAMHADTSLGGNCMGLSLISSHNSLEFVQSGNYGVVQQMYSIKYDFNPGANVT
jgi:hypothetical protein|tara:strand:- start:6552 stop:7070 length:519 start_codon:yes stop_codon:yes gene_type:complete